jgi:predicted DNA-binding transcriptional regulator AlpA
VPKFIRFPELSDYGVPAFTRKHIIDLQKQGKFSKARQLSANRVAWLEDEILAWANERPVARSVRDAGQTDGELRLPSASKFWITDGRQSRRVSDPSDLPRGWRVGRASPHEPPDDPAPVGPRLRRRAPRAAEVG